MLIGDIVFLIHLIVTLLITGVIWCLQIIHYPLFQHVPSDNFSHYIYKHTQRAGFLTAPLMFSETVTGVLLLWWRPWGINLEEVWIGLGLIVVILIITTFLHMPQHEKLTSGFNEGSFRALVRNSWLRTLVWTLRSGWVVWMLLQAQFNFSLPG